MKSLSLSPGQRLGLLDILGTQQGTLAEVLPFYRLTEIFRISESEAQEIGLTFERTSNVTSARWNGTVEPRIFQIEDSDARALAGLLDSWPHFKPSDLPWLLPIKDSLG